MQYVVPFFELKASRESGGHSESARVSAAVFEYYHQNIKDLHRFKLEKSPSYSDESGTVGHRRRAPFVNVSTVGWGAICSLTKG